MTSTTAQQHAAQATQAFHAAQSDLQDATHRLQAHEARRPRAGATADQIKAWASEKGTLIAEVEAYEGIAAEVRANAQQATEAARAEVKANLYEERRGALAEAEQRMAPAAERMKAAMAELAAAQGAFRETEQLFLDEVWHPWRQRAEQSGMFHFSEYQERRNQAGALMLPSDRPADSVLNH